MSTIDEIREQSKTVWAVSPLTQTKNDTSTDDEFANLLEKMKTGHVSGGSGGSDSSDDTKTRTVTEVLSDGSVLVTVWEGNKIVSQDRPVRAVGIGRGKREGRAGADAGRKLYRWHGERGSAGAQCLDAVVTKSQAPSRGGCQRS